MKKIKTNKSFIGSIENIEKREERNLDLMKENESVKWTKCNFVLVKLMSYKDTNVDCKQFWIEVIRL